jgi:hypothetical protein
MKLGTENKTKMWIAVGLAVVAVYFGITRLPSMLSAPPAQPTAVPRSAGPNIPAAQPQRRSISRKGAPKTAVLTPTLDPRLRLDLLKVAENTNYEGSGRNIFRAESEPAPIPRPIVPPTPGPGGPGGSNPIATNLPPPPPPIPLKFFGVATRPGEPKRALLADGEDVFVAKEGDIVDRHYKINKIGVNSVEIQDVLTNNVQTIPLTAQG